MCGIVGLINPQEIPLPDLSSLKVPFIQELSRGMIHLIRHRGPDETGILEMKNGFLGNARLSIIDLKEGTQPISNKDGSIWIVYNGEIYDHDLLRNQLRSKGHTFTTKTDTEVIIHLYEEYGSEFIRYLNGEFCFCLYDRRKDTYFLYRDYFGTKPLYYLPLAHNAFLFSSDIKPLLWATGEAKPSLSADAAAQNLESWVSLPPLTPYTGIYQIPPSSVGIIRSNEGIKTIHFKIQNSLYQPENTDLHKLFENSISRRLKADVPVGVYLSGGLDSAIVTSLATQQSNYKLNSFSVEFEQEGFDESPDQKKLQEFFQTQHHVVRVSNKEIVENFIPALLAGETSVFRTAFVPMYLLSKLVQSCGLKVVLTGEGADELFGGYDLYRELIIMQEWAQRPDDTHYGNQLSQIYHYLPEFSPENQRLLVPFYKSFLGKMGESFAGHTIRWSGYNQSSKLLTNPPASPTRESLSKQYRYIESLDIAEQCREVEILTLLHGYLLSTQGDKMASIHSVEPRLPFLDVAIANFALSNSPLSYINKMREKFILYSTFEHDLPKFIQKKRKTPYLAPDAEIFFIPQNMKFWADYISDQNIEDAGIFSTKEVKSLLNRMMTLAKNQRRFSRRDNTNFFTILSLLILRSEIGKIAKPLLEFKIDKIVSLTKK